MDIYIKLGVIILKCDFNLASDIKVNLRRYSIHSKEKIKVLMIKIHLNVINLDAFQSHRGRFSHKKPE